ncbi:efflux RND transporter periplasmic adaptor subunit [Clostridiales bacterium AM23-16LB]|nr:efflux RND transporter periplasmic adaptor subunit [Clostridiales bacterium AM23-16LB]RHR45801.1 efflux RND transporter periplasmic adaptor subunit [Clostridiaceae bacterium AF18-31LB]
MHKFWRRKKEQSENTTELVKAELTPQQKKKRKKRIIGGVIAAALVLFIVSRVLTPAALPMVMVRSAEKGTVKQTIDTSGTVKTEQQKTYFSPLAAKVEACKVQEGDAVEAGQVLLTYDAQDLENRKKEAALQNDEAYYGYQNTMDKNSKDTSEYSRSSHDVEILEQQVENAKAEVRALKQYLTDMGCFLREAQNDNHKNLAEEYQAKIDQATNQLAVKEEELAEFQSDLSEQKGIKNSTESTMMTADAKKQAEAAKELQALKSAEVTDAVAQVSDGIKADFAGIVTGVKAVDGSNVENGGELFTVSSIEKVCVDVSFSKSDLEKIEEGQKAVATIAGKQYEGTVTRISRAAAKNEKGASIIQGEIHIDNPDADLYLGVDARVMVEGNKAENVVMIPVEAINIGKDGSFVYVVTDGMVQKRMVTAGISSDEYTEIKKGLEVGEQVIISVDAGIEEGMAVNPVEG